MPQKVSLVSSDDLKAPKVAAEQREDEGREQRIQQLTWESTPAMDRDRTMMENGSTTGKIDGVSLRDFDHLLNIRSGVYR